MSSFRIQVYETGVVFNLQWEVWTNEVNRPNLLGSLVLHAGATGFTSASTGSSGESSPFVSCRGTTGAWGREGSCLLPGDSGTTRSPPAAVACDQCHLWVWVWRWRWRDPLGGISFCIVCMCTRCMCAFIKIKKENLSSYWDIFMKRDFISLSHLVVIWPTICKGWYYRTSAAMNLGLHIEEIAHHFCHQRDSLPTPIASHTQWDSWKTVFCMFVCQLSGNVGPLSPSSSQACDSREISHGRK